MNWGFLRVLPAGAPRDFSPETHFQAHLRAEQPRDKVSELGGPDRQAGCHGNLMSTC